MNSKAKKIEFIQSKLDELSHQGLNKLIDKIEQDDSFRAHYETESLDWVQVHYKNRPPHNCQYPPNEIIFATFWFEGNTRFIREPKVSHVNINQKCKKCRSPLSLHGYYPDYTFGQRVCPGSILIRGFRRSHLSIIDMLEFNSIYSVTQIPSDGL
jgi:hypothetical protein